MSTVLITGAGRGFGRELLDVYAERGWVVFPLLRDQKVADDLSQAFPSGCFPIVSDVTSESLEDRIVAALQKHAPALDLLINNAGSIRKARGAMEAPVDDMLSYFNVHCVGALRCTRAALPFLRKAPKPVVVNITSRFGSIGKTAAAGHSSARMVYSYKIAKSAQNMLTACLNRELRGENILVHAVHPGRLLTSAAARDADTDPREAAERLFEWVGQVDESLACKCYDLMGGGTIEW
ncbi:MAG: SDR family NAD(P)-dependent oxidoreductase [Candidatus Zixiibacteriota bacterium]|nr:MAG: SDR family NAD(P)-dependent oxidoreductase [candidate division Zixibacteria bacterium]